MRKPCTNCLFHCASAYRGKFEPDYRFEQCNDCTKYIKYKCALISRQKFVPGETIKSFEEFESHLPDLYFYLCGKIKHHSILENFQYKVLKGFIKAGLIKTAIRKHDNEN